MVDGVAQARPPAMTTRQIAVMIQMLAAFMCVLLGMFRHADVTVVGFHPCFGEVNSWFRDDQPGKSARPANHRASSPPSANQVRFASVPTRKYSARPSWSFSHSNRASDFAASRPRSPPPTNNLATCLLAKLDMLLHAWYNANKFVDNVSAGG